MLYTNVVCSEIARDVKTVDPNTYIEKYWKQTPPFFWVNASMSLIDMCKAYQAAGGGYQEKYRDTMADYKKPMLTLQGTLDPQTPPLQSFAWRDHYSSNNTKQYFVFAR